LFFSVRGLQTGTINNFQ